MIASTSLAAGLAVYQVVLAAIGWFCREAPGGLARVLAQLRGEDPQHRTPWPSSLPGGLLCAPGCSPGR